MFRTISPETSIDFRPTLSFEDGRWVLAFTYNDLLYRVAFKHHYAGEEQVAVICWIDGSEFIVVTGAEYRELEQTARSHGDAIDRDRYHVLCSRRESAVATRVDWCIERFRMLQLLVSPSIS